MRISRVFILISLLCLISAINIGCDGDDDETDSGVDGGPIDTDSSGMTANFAGTLVGFPVATPAPGQTVIALNNDSAAPLAGFETVSAADGAVTFTNLPVNAEGLVGFKVLGVAGQFVETYQFNIKGENTGERLWIMPKSAYEMAINGSGLAPLDTTKGVTSGGAYWVDAEGKEWPIGCGTVRPATGTADVRYAGDNNLPTTLDNQANLNPTNGYWVAANLTPGRVEMQVVVNNVVVGRALTHAYAGTTTSIGNIYADEEYTENPGECP